MTNEIPLDISLKDLGITPKAIIILSRSAITPESWEQVASLWAAAALLDYIPEKVAVKRITRCWKKAEELRKKNGEMKEFNSNSL